MLSNETYALGRQISFAFVCDFSVSGSKSFAIAKAAGADMTDAEIRCDALMPKLTYAANTEPEK